MPPGPIPNPDRRRRNAPTIPTTKLPAGGRSGRTPRPPSWVTLGKSGRAWWRWAWSTPQASGWSIGDEPIVARRAVLEDDLASLDTIDAGDFDIIDLLGEERQELASQLSYLIAKLRSLAGGRLAVLREMREIDDRLGLTPKGMAQLRWTIVADPEQLRTEGSTSTRVTDLDERRRRLAADAS